MLREQGILSNYFQGTRDQCSWLDCWDQGNTNLHSITEGFLDKHSLTHCAHSSSSPLRAWSIRPRNNKCHPSIAVLRYLLSLIPACPFQIFPFGFNGSPPSGLWYAGPLLPSRVQVNATLQLLSFSLLKT